MKESDKKRRTVLRPDKTILRRTLFLLAVCGIVAFVVLAVKLYEIQIVKHDHYEELAVEQQTRQATIAASRGTIYDTNGKILAMSASVETVFISPYEMNLYEEDKNLIASNLSEILEVDRDSILRQMEDTASWYKTVKKKIEAETATQVREFIQQYKLKSVHLEADSKRHYPFSSLASQVVGFVGDDNTGLEGIEFRYDQYLTGTNGRIVRLKNGKGTDLLFSDYEDYYDATDGNNLTLTIDSTIQYYVEKSLAQAIEDYDVQKGGACIAMNPKTGEILAMANFENYDPNNYAQISEKAQSIIDAEPDEQKKKELMSEARFRQWRNKSLSDTYEPGSVFKIITLAMALEENSVTESDHFFCGGSIDVLGRGAGNPQHCWQTRGHGSQTLVEAIKNSCNVALINIGLGLGAENFYEYARAFGFFDKTGIDLQGESSSLWWTEDVFYDKKNLSQLASASFGQTFNITPIQLITAVSASINGGNLIKPHIVKEVTDGEGNIIEAFEPEVVRQAISAETSARVRTILEDVVKTGTGKNAYVKGYRIGGKTGTSEKVAQLVTGQKGEEEYIVSFCGFAPADDPEIVILLLLDTPNEDTGIYISGGVMAAPVVGKMMSDILPHIGVEPVYTEEERKSLNVSVPKLLGITADNAKKELGDCGLDIKLIGGGAEVTGQMPAANAVVAPGTTVLVYMGESAPENTVAIPDLSNLSYKNAKARLEQAGLFIRSIGALPTYSTSVVATQSILPGEEVSVGTVVEVTLVDSSISGRY